MLGRATGAAMAYATGVLLAAASPAMAQHAPPGAGPGSGGRSMVRLAAVFGKDDRVPLPAAYRGLKQQIGVLYEPRSRSVCTAFCVAHDIVATAAHCIFRTEGQKPLPLTDMWFRLGMRNGKSQARIAGADAGTAVQNIMAGSMRLSVRPPIDASHDWALVRLARPACAAGGLKLSSRPASEVTQLAAERRVYQVAFHRDFRDWELALSPCEVNPAIEGVDQQSLARDFSDAGQLLLHTCDSGGASSGSPLLINGPAGPEVVGVNVGTYVQSKIMMQNNEVVRRFRPDEIANTGVSTVALAPRLDLFAKARMIGERNRMREMQILLEGAGFPSGPPDGLYGPGVKAAIENYERSERLAVTGLPTETLLRRLGGGTVPVAERRPRPLRHSLPRVLQKFF